MYGKIRSSRVSPTLTAHEAARLQFFPDFFDFGAVKSRTRLAIMIGNAVPPKISYVLFMAFLLAAGVPVKQPSAK